jgi:signal transduction histidine kinase
MAEIAPRAAPVPRIAPKVGRRLAVALALALGVALLLRGEWTPGLAPLLARTVILALVGVLVFGLLERWPRRLPGWIARWALQVVGVGVVMPLTTVAIYALSTRPGAPPFWLERDRMDGFMMLTFLAILLAPWTALAALLRQREAFVREQALAFELERTRLESEANAARLDLLQSQVAPHFLFNTLANVQALVDAGSPRASEVLRRLTTYLRAAVPRLDEPADTVGRELERVEAYLELMKLRIPDRLDFEVGVDPSVLGLECPPTTLLTLAENAVRHGIDPAEEGGRIEVAVELRGDRCRMTVVDTGVGLAPHVRAGGTGLATLRRRLQLLYGEAARLELSGNTPRGVLAEIEIPAVGVRG